MLLRKTVMNKNVSVAQKSRGQGLRSIHQD